MKSASLSRKRCSSRPTGIELIVPRFMKEIIAEVTHLARRSPDISQRSGVSVRVSISNYENIIEQLAAPGDPVG